MKVVQFCEKQNTKKQWLKKNKKERKMCLKTTAVGKLTQTGWSQYNLEDHESKSIQFYLH